MAVADRYLTAQQFGKLLSELKLTPNVFQDQLLQFLERNQILLPAARLRLPSSVVYDDWKEASTSTASPDERATADALSVALSRWDRGRGTETVHPFDHEGEVWTELVSKTFPPESYMKWLDLRTQVSEPDEPLLFSPHGFETYYHRWQALLVADILDMGVKLLFDTTQKDLMDIAHEERFNDLPSSAYIQTISYEGPNGLKNGRRWSAFFDVAAKLEVELSRVVENIKASLPEGQTQLDEGNLAQIKEVMGVKVLSELEAINGDEGDLFKFLTYLCERWDDWQDKGRAKIEQEYKHQIMLVTRMLMHLQNSDFEAVSTRLGQVTGHFKNTLEAVFPDWIETARRSLDLSLRHSVVKVAPQAEPRLALKEGDVPDFIEWLERSNFIKIHSSILEIIEHQFKNGNENRSVILKESEAISMAFEHVVGALIDEHEPPNVTRPPTLMLKLDLLWRTYPDIVQGLKVNKGKVQTKDGVTRAQQSAAIAALSTGGNNLGVIKCLLLAVMYRNDGSAHKGMGSWADNELRDASTNSLTAMMFCWKCRL